MICRLRQTNCSRRWTAQMLPLCLTSSSCVSRENVRRRNKSGKSSSGHKKDVEAAVEGTIKVLDADDAHQMQPSTIWFPFVEGKQGRCDVAGQLQLGAARQRIIEASMSTLLYTGL